jgi:cytochrome P450
MLHFPDACRKAQAEIDAMVGRDRLPNHEDRENLPFTRALILETQRWRPLTPIGVPHVAIEVSPQILRDERHTQWYIG